MSAVKPTVMYGRFAMSGRMPARSSARSSTSHVQEVQHQVREGEQAEHAAQPHQPRLAQQHRQPAARTA